MWQSEDTAEVMDKDVVVMMRDGGASGGVSGGACMVLTAASGGEGYAAVSVARYRR